MTLTLTLDDKAAAQLAEDARLAGESIEERASRLLASSLKVAPQPAETSAHPVPRKRFVVKPFALEYPEEWKGLTPSQILEKMDDEEFTEKNARLTKEYLEQRDRSGREPSPIRS